MPAQGWLERIGPHQTAGSQHNTGRACGAPSHNPRITAMTDRTDTSYDAIFVGGGVIGLACAWRAAQRGADVCVLERDRPAAGATGGAGGMLAPVGEASWGEEALLALNRESLRCWPAFAKELEAEAETEVEF